MLVRPQLGQRQLTAHASTAQPLNAQCTVLHHSAATAHMLQSQGHSEQMAHTVWPMYKCTVHGLYAKLPYPSKDPAVNTCRNYWQNLCQRESSLALRARVKHPACCQTLATALSRHKMQGTRATPPYFCWGPRFRAATTVKADALHANKLC